MDIDLIKLKPTHDTLRNLGQLDQMVEFVRAGNTFDRTSLDVFAKDQRLKPSPLVQISVFEDGEMFIHDGHHRVLSMHLAQRDRLFVNEYNLTYWEYEKYLEINFDDGWVTPFDPRTEVRVANLKEWKRKVSEVRTKFGDKQAVDFIVSNRETIVRPRGLITGIWHLTPGTLKQ